MSPVHLLAQLTLIPSNVQNLMCITITTNNVFSANVISLEGGTADAAIARISFQMQMCVHSQE